MGDDRKADNESGWMRRFGELGPAWIGALATLIVALTGAGFFAGRITGQPAPQATVTITDPASPNTVGTSPSAPQSVSPPAPRPAAAVANGVHLGSYSIDLAAGYAVPLGPTRPTQSEYSATGNGDLYKVFSRLDTGRNDQMVILPDGVTPTYQKCANATNLTTEVIPTVGTSFCLIETTGLIAGAEVTALGSSGDAIIAITIWKHSA
jgi:hypothetical protein